MSDRPGHVSAAITARRSVRSFRAEPVDTTIVRDLVRIACTAPAPHGSRPWRFVHVAQGAVRERLADAMNDAWRGDLVAEGRPVLEIDRLIRGSRSQIMGAPALLVACLVLNEARDWPDAGRKRAERDMFMQSLGAALQNLLLAAGERGLVGYLKGAPLFCQEAMRSALSLPGECEPAFLVLLGHADGTATPAERPPITLEEFLIER